MTDEPNARGSPEASDADSELRPEPLSPQTVQQPPVQMAGRYFKQPQAPPIQFSLGEFLIWIAIVSVGLSGLSWVRPEIHAGICGGLAVAMLIFFPIERPQSAAKLVFTAFLAMYAITFVIALVRHGR